MIMFTKVTATFMKSKFNFSVTIDMEHCVAYATLLSSYQVFLIASLQLSYYYIIQESDCQPC